VIGPLQALFAAVRRFWARRAARRLLAAGLPRGLPGSLQKPLLALRPSPLPAMDEASFHGLPFGAAAIRGKPPPLLLRLSALPRAPGLGVARPSVFRLDAELRPPAESDPLRTSSDAAPLTWRWVRPDFRREIVDLPWMARDRIAFLAPRPVEWFTMWWLERQARTAGGRDAVPYELPRELDWALEHCKEQMLIRRDVKKDETALEPGRLVAADVGFSMTAVEDVPLTALIEKPEWIEPFDMTPQDLPFEPRARAAYLQWRTLLNSLADR
jgi:hypothetical protein